MRQSILFAYGSDRLHSSFVVWLEWPVVTPPVEERQRSVHALYGFADYGAFTTTWQGRSQGGAPSGFSARIFGRS
jgi:hypothetical protein